MGVAMVSFIRGMLLGALVLVVGLGTTGCGGADTGQKPAPKGGGGGDMMGKKMREAAQKYGRGNAGQAEKDKKDKDKDEDKDKDKEKQKDQAKEKDKKK